jgi:hypothetical protein
MFSPQIYTSLVALRENSVLGAHSDTTIDNIDVFGWFEGNAYACKYVYDADMDADVAYAGDCIDIVEGEDQEAVSALRKIVRDNDKDWEVIHMEADKLLCSLLEDKYPQLVKEFKSLNKWYA